jgi:hypothetical protein
MDINVIGQMSDDPDGDVSRWSEIALRNIQLRGGDAERPLSFEVTGRS